MVSKTITFNVQDAEQATGTVTIDWGDGSANTTLTNQPFDGTNITANHDYTVDGTYTVTVTANDLQSSNNIGTSTDSVTISSGGGTPATGVPTITINSVISV